MNHYEILGVSSAATQNEIRQAYRRLAQQHHPDKGGDPAVFRAAQQAYEVLSDADRRAAYDAGEPDPAAAADKLQASVRVAASQMLNKAIAEASVRGGVDHVDVLAKVRGELHDSLSANEEASRTLGEQVYEAQRAQRRLEYRGEGESFLHGVLANRILAIEAEQVKVAAATEVCLRTLDLLAEYSYEVAPEAAPQPAGPFRTFTHFKF